MRCSILAIVFAFRSQFSSEAFVLPQSKFNLEVGTKLQATAPSDSTNSPGNNSSSSSSLPSTRQIAIQALIPPNPKSKRADDFSPITRLESSKPFLALQDQRDKSFSRNLVSTTLRRMGQIDSILTHCCKVYPPTGGKGGKEGAVLQAALRVGVAQLLFLDTPAFAVVQETVEALKKVQIQGSKRRMPKPMVSFCNAILRRVDRERDELLDMTNASDNVSDFLMGEFRKSYGTHHAEMMVEQLLNEEAHNSVDISLNHVGLKNEEERQASTNEIVAAFSDETVGIDSVLRLPNGSLRILKGSYNGAISKWPLYDNGSWWVQDVSSTLPALALTSAMKSAHGDENLENLHVVDMCAAPGGKTAQLLSSNFHVTAIEANKRRSRRLLENLERLQLEEKCEVVVSPGQEWTPEESIRTFNTNGIAGVLVDVPCSATGTGNRRPDVLRKDQDLGNLLETQEILANHCVDNILKGGGIMVYATCSLLPRESEDQIHKLIKRGGVETLPFTPGEIPGFDGAIDKNGWLRVLPGVLDGDLKQCDGFFVARLVKM